MLVGKAHGYAQAWVLREHERIAGYVGAYLAGSTCWLPPDADVPLGSDVDINLVVDDAALTAKPGKVIEQGALLEINLIPASMLTDLKTTLSRPAIVTSMAQQRIIHDPHHVIAPVFATIAREFPRRIRVTQRLDLVQRDIADRLGQVDPARPFHEQAMWVFPATVTTFLPMTAALRNPTVRRRHVETARLCQEYGEPVLQDTLLGAINAADITQADAEAFLGALAPVYDQAAITPSTSSWTNDVSPETRPIAIDGTWAMIREGYHREAMFWIVAGITRSLSVLAAATIPIDLEPARVQFLQVMVRLRLDSTAALQRQSAAVIATLPEIRAAAERIMARNPAITD